MLNQKMYKELLEKLEKEKKDMEFLLDYVKYCSDFSLEETQLKFNDAIETIDLYLTTTKNMIAKYGDK